MSGMKRLFFGLELNEAARNAVADAAGLLRFEKGSLHERNNYHLTLVFLGMTDERAVPELERLSRLAAGKPFDLTLSGRLDTFKGGSIVWAGVDESAPLMTMQKTLRAIMEENGFVPHEDGYTPHITLGRNMRGVSALPPVRRETFRVEGITLFESLREDERLVYRPIFRTW